MLSVIVLLLCLSGLVFIALIAILSKKREVISYEIEHGIICCSCKEIIYYDSDQLQNWPPSTKRELCLKCKRDDILGEILEKKHTHLFYFVYSKKWKYTFLYLSLFSIIVQVSNIFLHTSFLSIVGGGMLFVTHGFNFMNFLYITRPKKPNQVNDWVFFIWSITPLVKSSLRTDSQV